MDSYFKMTFAWWMLLLLFQYGCSASNTSCDGGKCCEFEFAEGAIASLGPERLAKIKEASKFNGDVAELANLLHSEADLGLDRASNRLIYRCQSLAVNASEEELKAAASIIRTAPRLPETSDNIVTLGLTDPDPILTPAQVFSLSSRPSAVKKIYLDFDGHITTGTDWNVQTGKASLITPPYDKDGSPSNFSAEELGDIVAIWRAVSEDFAIFDVDVTLRDPGQGALAGGNGMRAAIGGAALDWLGSQAGGVAYLNSFGDPKASPCFVFPKDLGPYYPKYIWEAVSHELGHTLGLRHDGVLGGTPYFKGQGDWATIMGVSYFEPVTQWDKGEYRNSNNLQDDILTMRQYLPLLPPSTGNTTATATPLTITTSTTSNTAVGTGFATLHTPNEINVFSFEAGFAGEALIVTEGPAKWGELNRGNLDMQVMLTNAAGDVILPASNAGDSLGVTVNVKLPEAGVYYVHVIGVGAGDSKSGGYSSYGSLGQYKVTVTFPAAAAQAEIPQQQHDQQQED